MQLYEAISSSFLPGYMNLGMVKWLRFSYFVLSWLFSPKIANNISVTVKAENENGIKYIHVLGKFLFLHTYKCQANIFAADTKYFEYKTETVVSPILLQVSSEWNWNFCGPPCIGAAWRVQIWVLWCCWAGEGAATGRISTCLKCTRRTNCL